MAGPVDARPLRFVRWSLRLFGPLAARRISNHAALPHKLLRANNPLVPTAYLATVYMRMAVVAAIGLVLFLLYLFTRDPDPRIVVVSALAPVLFGFAMYSYDLLRPDLEANSRKRNLEANLPYALNFMASLSSAGVLPVEVYGALSRQRVYGEVAVESGRIYRDAKLFSKDLVTAVQDAAQRSPSQQFEEFLQGSVNTVTSGGDFTGYLMARSDHYATENRRKMRAFLDSMGVMAEAYVVVAAAAPLFLMVIISVMLFLSSGSRDPIFFMNILVLVGLPVIHAAFTYILRNMRPE